jgi:hypothetical protein
MRPAHHRMLSNRLRIGQISSTVRFIKQLGSAQSEQN